MKYRPLGRTGWNVSEISFGAWAIGGFWGKVSDQDSLAALNQAIDCGVNFFDTADVYGDGRSERLIAQLKKSRKEEIIVATKAGRRLPKQTVEGYSRENLTTWVEDSLRNLSADAIDLLQLHSPSTDVYYHPEVFGILDDLVKAGKIRYYGVSVEKVEEALKAIEYPKVQTVQIIFNCFRLRPAELFFPQAKQKQVGILARVPLASGLLTGKLRRDSQFAPDDHRTFNRHGELFDAGETFSGVDYDTALAAVEDLRKLLTDSQPSKNNAALAPPFHVLCGAWQDPVSMAQFALRWILMFDAVSCAIPGGKTAAQVADNCRASDLPPLTPESMSAVQRIYDEKIRPLVHQRW
jgi:aryl-alcohol dehydrogenase-like predicted oxidoreductase